MVLCGQHLRVPMCMLLDVCHTSAVRAEAASPEESLRCAGPCITPAPLGGW